MVPLRCRRYHRISHCLRRQLSQDQRQRSFSCGLCCFHYHNVPVRPPAGSMTWTILIIPYRAIVAALLLLVKPKNIVRDDGRHLAVFKQPNMKTEILGVWSVMSDPKIILLLPAMFAGEMILAPASSINGTTTFPLLLHLNQVASQYTTL